MAENDEVPRIPGIRDVSPFFRHFNGEDVVVRPLSDDQDPFVIEVLIDNNEVKFAPRAPVHEGDTLERDDPRGGVIEHSISHLKFSRDPFKHGNDHWVATLSQEGHKSRPFAEPKIVVHGGTNQISFGDGNQLHQTNLTPESRQAIAALDKILELAPRNEFSADQAESLQEAISDAKLTITSGKKSSITKRSLYGLRGVIGELAETASSGAKDAVKVWSATATALLIQHISGL